MEKFCVKCGAPLNSGPFCVKCGTDMRSVGTPTAQSPNSVVQMPNTQAMSTPSQTPTEPGMSTLAKLGIAAVAILFVGGAAGAVGVYYVAHKVSHKYHEVSGGILGSTSDSAANSSGNTNS